MRTLSALSLDQQIGGDGTWLDRELTARYRSAITEGGFGREVNKAMGRRAQRLVDMGPATAKDGNIHIPSSSVATLERRRSSASPRCRCTPSLQKACGRLAPRGSSARGFTGKVVRGRILPMRKKAWAAKFKKYAVLAGINEPKKSCHGARKARAGVAAYADCTESQMMATFSWTDPKMPAHHIAKANREKLGMSGMDKIDRVRSEPIIRAARWDATRERSGDIPGEHPKKT